MFDTPIFPKSPKYEIIKHLQTIFNIHNKF